MPIFEGWLDSRLVDVLELPLLHGRTPDDGERVVLVNQAFARAFWGRDDVVGEIVPDGVIGRGREIVGVLADLSFKHPAAVVEPFTFEASFTGVATRSVIEASLTAAQLQQELRRIAASEELEIEVSEVTPLRDLRNHLIAPDRARGMLTITTAVLVVLLAAIGFYGTQQFLVAAGRREYAIRASLGAGPTALGRLVVWRGLMLGLPGLVLGALLSFTVVAWLRDDYVGRDTSPGLVTLAVVIGLSVLLFAASVGPARMVRRTPPAPLLRED